MKIAKTLIAGMLFLCALTAYADMWSEIEALDWTNEPGVHKIANTHGSVELSSLGALFQGRNAKEFMRVTEGHDGFQPDAIVLYFDDKGEYIRQQIVYTEHPIGHVEMDDWGIIDPDALLQEIRANTEENNKSRAAGLPRLYVDGWLQKPYLDRANAMVYWAIKGSRSDGGSYVNAKALKLSREGYTEVIWIGQPEEFHGAHAALNPALNAYQLDQGSMYADFVPGRDAVAAAGVGALAYTTITGKSRAGKAVGAGVLALIAALAKKAWMLALVPFVVGWNWLKKAVFGSKKGDLDELQ